MQRRSSGKDGDVEGWSLFRLVGLLVPYQAYWGWWWRTMGRPDDTTVANGVMLPWADDKGALKWWVVHLRSP